jgi:hypothetical protein
MRSKSAQITGFEMKGDSLTLVLIVIPICDTLMCTETYNPSGGTWWWRNSTAVALVNIAPTFLDHHECSWGDRVPFKHRDYVCRVVPGAPDVVAKATLR